MCLGVLRELHGLGIAHLFLPSAVVGDGELGAGEAPEKGCLFRAGSRRCEFGRDPRDDLLVLVCFVKAVEIPHKVGYGGER